MKSVNNLLWCVCLFVFISFPYFFSMVSLFAFFSFCFSPCMFLLMYLYIFFRGFISYKRLGTIFLKPLKNFSTNFLLSELRTISKKTLD